MMNKQSALMIDVDDFIERLTIEELSSIEDCFNGIRNAYCEYRKYLISEVGYVETPSEWSNTQINNKYKGGY